MKNIIVEVQKYVQNFTLYTISYNMIKTVILARGGSKGIPQKNIVSLNGKPLISYAIEAAKSSIANDVWVSTDCTNIKEVAIKYGAKVIIRPDNISGDSSKSDEALMHFAQNQDFDILVFIQPTSPLIKADDINKGLELMANYDSVFSAYKEHWIPRWTLDGKPYNWDINSRPMRQDVSEKYVENGALYITTREQLLKSGLRYGDNIGVLEMPYRRSVQIDTYDDLNLISNILQQNDVKPIDSKKLKLNRKLLTIPNSEHLYLNKSVCLLGCGSSLSKHDIDFSEYDVVAGINRIYQTNYMQHINVLYYNLSSADNKNLDSMLYKKTQAHHFKYIVFCPWSSGPQRRESLQKKLQKYQIDTDSHVYSKGIVRKLTQINRRPLTGVAAVNHILLSGASKIDVFGFDFYTNQYVNQLKRFNSHNRYHDIESNKKFLLNLIEKHPNKIIWHQ